MTDLLSARDFLQHPRQAQAWVVEDILPAGGLLNIYGPPKEGKSLAALQLARSIAGDCPSWLGLAILRPGPTVYIQLDTADAIWSQKVRDLQLLDGLPETLYLPNPAAVPRDWDIHTTGGRWLKTAIASLPTAPVAVFLDTLRELHGGDENQSGVMRAVVASVVRATSPAAVVLISHSHKPARDKDASAGLELMSGNRGSNYVAGRADAVIKVEAGTLTLQSRTCGLRRLTPSRDTKGFWR